MILTELSRDQTSIIDFIFHLVSDAYVTAQTDISCTEDEDPLNSTASLSEPVWWDNYHQVCYGLANNGIVWFTQKCLAIICEAASHSTMGTNISWNSM